MYPWFTTGGIYVLHGGKMGGIAVQAFCYFSEGD